MHRLARPARRLGRLAACILVLLAAAASPAAATASTSPEPSPSPSSLTITCELSAASVVYGRSIDVSGVVSDGVAGRQVVVALGGVDLATTSTGDGGAFSVPITPAASGDVSVRLIDDAGVSAARAVVVKPRVSVKHGTPMPFLRTRFVLSVAPATYTGTVVVRVVHRGVVVARLRTVVRDGRAVVKVPLNGIQWFTVRFALPVSADLAARTVEKRVEVEWRRLEVGSKGPRVKGFLTALSRLRIRVPGITTTFTAACADAAMVFQKAYRLPRTYVVGYDDWRKLDGAKMVRPRYSSPSTHLEVDKTRQILMVVKGGTLHGLICVSTGATDNTPEGSFRIHSKLPYSSSVYGGVLYRTMGFVGDFAIHGYSPVPPYPASHGCVREPMWVADWVYDHSFIGERLYVYD